MTRLKLTRPLIFFDLESTGTDPQTDRIVELAAVKLWPDGQRNEKCRRFYPTIHIPEAATAIHGITDDDVRDEPTFERVARGDKGIAAFFADCDLAGYNVLRYDIPLLMAEFARAEASFDLSGVAVLDAYLIFREQEPRDLSGAVRFYCAREHEGAHGAGADMQASMDVLEAQLERYPDLADTPGALDCRDPDSVDLQGKMRWVEGEVTLNFGKKHRGKTLRQVMLEDPSYLQWMLDKGVAPDAATILRAAMAGEFPGR
jgi:DNA polymerase-3 subunit epsilon